MFDNATLCACKLLARYENLFSHTVAVKRTHLSKDNNSVLIFTFLNIYPLFPI